VPFGADRGVVMARVWERAVGSRGVSTRLKQGFLGLSAVAVVAAFVMATALFMGSTRPAEAACTGPSGGVETCAGAGTQSDISYSPPVTTLTVNTLTIDPSRISLTGTGSAPAAPGAGVQHYTCSSNDPARCTITPATPASDGHAATAESCAGPDCIAPPATATGGAIGNSGPTLIVNYNQPGANPNVSGSGAVIATSTIGVLGASNGSAGGGGSDGYVFSNGGDGHDGAAGGAVTVNVDGAVQTDNNCPSTSPCPSAGIVASSVGGDGGNGGSAYGITGSAGKGGLGGVGGSATVNFTNGSVETLGDYSAGVVAISQGGHGGNGGGGGSLVFNPGGGNAAGGGGNANVVTGADTTIVTHGVYSHGIVAQSIGGGGGGSSGGFGLFSSSGGSGGNGGNGGVVSVTNNGDVTTWGNNSQGILAQTIGGGGGDGGSNFGLFASAGSGSLGGSGGPADVVTVGVTNSGAIVTHGQESNGILAQSIGGGGGNGGRGGGLVALGGAGSSTSKGGIVEVTNTKDGSISTDGKQSAGIFAQSVGGGGGNGGASSGLFAAGGKGGDGADGARVTVTNAGDIETGKNGSASVNSAGIFAQSVGGGGGNGGGAVATGAGFSVALGGAGGSGGKAGAVEVLRDATNTAYSIITHGDQSDAVFAQSIGGGGGNGGFSVSGAVGALALAMGGAAGDGSDGNTVTVQTAGTLTTTGNGSRGIFAQSVGGSGGNGGAAIAVALNATGTFAAAIGIGGNGGSGGASDVVTVSSLSDISTIGDNAGGIVAQSVGGGGGNGGYSIGGAIGGIGLAVNIGGKGSSGGAGADVIVGSSGSIHTQGDNSVGILAQSIGGGGGNGGFTVSASIGAASASIGLGGAGSVGSNAGDVTVNADGAGHTITKAGYAGTWNLITEGKNAAGIQAESIGGGGGNGGFSGSLALGGVASGGVSLGGSGAGGGDAATVTVNNGKKDNNGVITQNSILTIDDNSIGILAQSIGGGGGNGGFAIALSGSGSYEGAGGAAAVSVGGSGSTGGIGEDVTVTNYGNITTYGKQSAGILAQSLGGGGGNGGFSIGASFTTGAVGVGVAVGGSGGKGQSAGPVTVISTGNIETHGDQSAGIMAQSVGGGGGNGGFAGAGAITLQGVSAAVGLGGNGAGGGDAKTVKVTSTGDIKTYGDQSIGILAQSVGGGGGNGGSSVALAIGQQAGVAVGLGGKGGAAGAGLDVTVVSTGNISTGAGFTAGGVRGTGAAGILAQSVGGGGGNGGFGGSLGGGKSVAVGVSLGGDGAGGGDADIVKVTSTGNISTNFDNSSGIIAQSIGGGGGNGGFSLAFAGAIGDPASATGSVAIGGTGGIGGIAKDVTVTSTGTITTTGKFSNGILAQSIGGGGGNGGFAISGSATTGNAGIGVGVGGAGAGGSIAGKVIVNSYSLVDTNGNPVLQAPPANTVSIWTQGDNSSGIFAQSVGGGGGSGGFAGSLGVGLGGGGLGVSIGGGAGSGSNADTVTVTSYNNILTGGTDSFGILAQSVGGGGGNGGFAIALSGSQNGIAGSVAVGGKGSSGGNADVVTVTSTGNIKTTGDGSHAIFAQSVGGGGGNGGFAVSGTLSEGASLGIGIGGSGDNGGDAKSVTVTSTGDLRTEGLKADGILAQSVGGGGGNGGFTGVLAIALDGGAVGVGVGGTGKGGGDADTVTVTSTGNIVTLKNGSNGILAQSVGGGGGNGGAAVTATGAGKQASAAVSVGGSGGGGGTSKLVTVNNFGTIDTTGDKANGILAQSIGGGGGTGGFAISGDLQVDGAGGASVALGGGGGTGQDGGPVIVNSNVGTTLTNNIATIHTVGGDSNGIFAQSVGGGGGDGGFSGAITVTGQNAKAAAAVSIGGSGAGSGDGKTVNVTSVDNILTEGDGSNGILAQSVGGGGGNGGFAFAATIKGSLGKNQSKNGSVSVSLGGSAGSGGDAEKVTVDSTGIIQTGGKQAFGVLAQSIGGGGGNGGLSVAAALNLGEAGNQITVAVGGEGGGGGAGGEVQLTRHGATITTGDKSVGLFAQSVGGSGGNGGMAISGAIAGTDAKTLSASVGGFGGDGTYGGKVTVDNTGAISTYGLESHAIQAQSIGGGGGNGGMAISAAVGSLGTGSNFNVGVSVGGLGGDGGFAGDVFVTNHGLLQTGLLAAGQTVTNGDGAYGIFAQSIGGGGGSGGNAITGLLGLNGNNEGTQVNVSVAVGGAAGNGNYGGNVTIRQYGGIETSGVGAFGILAQSIGGGGGTGGRANSISLELGARCTLAKVCEPAGGKPNWNLQATVGGAGGTGNDGQQVDVGNYDFITTNGDKSSAIVAQSIGGGGGIGGDAYMGTGGLFTIPYVEVDPTLLLKPLGTGSLTRSGAVAIGGNGAGGGNGGTVIVTNEGIITTNGTKSDGIHAQSIGGGGGDGGDGQAGALGTVGIGGKGAAAGNGGTVTVTNGKNDAATNNGVYSQAKIATIETFGTSPTPPAEGAPSADPEQGYSAGIFAQSVGGGGGTGGGAGGLLSLGGSGKAGGTGGLVTVDNYGGIVTHADDSVGIFAQSIGGGGGAGGTLGISAIAVGGSGGASGAGGDVIVTNDAVIITHGIDSYAIQAQSVGGGGGSGGGKNGGITGSIPALISIGGAGGSSGIGGTVTVTNNNGLHTFGAGADGINAQSIGGGGGSGGRSIGFIAVGGKGGDVGDGTMAGSDGNGGAVNVYNNAGGNILVEGVGAHGIFAQSVGAGGGSGGGGIGASIVPTSVGVGGDGGSSGDGGVVTVENHGQITTIADASVAIFAESVGGGGGTGAMSIAAALSPGALTFGVGGDGGANGNGGNINVTNFSDGVIYTKGFGSTGIMAQSVGGGGGSGGASYSVAGGVPGFSLALGGKGAAGGDGGVVTVVNNGVMQLDGDNSVAIFAQSVGGGGGKGGTAIAATIGPPVFIGGDTGVTGKGGDVTVTNTGQIVLKGNGSVGIFAQSVGGGGGVMTAGTDGIIQAVSGGKGDGGVVTINSNVAMLITGDNSVGVFGQSIGGGGGVGGFSGNYLGLDQAPAASSMMMAMVAAPQGFMGSAGGAGLGGDVTFEQKADLYVTGKNSSALMEQSSGGSGNIADNGDINVTIDKDILILGGSGAGAGVTYLDGRNNVLNNNGYVGAVTGDDGCTPGGVDTNCVRKIDGYAMRGGVGNDTYNNFKDTMGSIALGDGQNAFNNEKGAIYRMGDTVDLGSTGEFTNDGYVAPGDLNRVMTTYVNGNWTQSATGTYLLDLDLDPEADQINITGTADLQGVVSLNIMEPGAAKPGTQEYLILHADQGVTNHDLVLDSIPSAVAQYQLLYPNSDDVVLNVDINFARSGLTQNQTSVGNAVNAIQTDLTSPAFTKIAEALFYIPTLGQLGAVYDSISGEGVSGVEQPQFDAYDTFLASMNRQANFWRTGLGTGPTDRSLTPQAYDEPAPKKDPFKAMQPDERRWSYWATAGGNSGQLSGDAIVGSAQNVYQGGNFAVGLDSAGNPDVLMGFALGGAAASFDVADRQTYGNIIGAQAGAYVARKWDDFYINGGLAFGLYNNNVHRAASVPGSNAPLNPVPGVSTENWRSNFLSAGFGANVEAGWRQQVGQGAITPFAALQFSFLSMDGFDETSIGGNSLGLSFDQRVITSLPVSLGLQLDTTIGVGDGQSLQAWGRAAWVHEFEPDRSVRPSFQAAPGYSFVIQGAAAAENAVAVNAGLKMNWSNNTAMFAAFDGKFGDGVQTYGGNVGLKVNW